MRPTAKTKDQERQLLAKKTAAFLASGGKIKSAAPEQNQIAAKTSWREGAEKTWCRKEKGL